MDETPTPDALRILLAELRAKSPRHAELAEILETILAEAQARHHGVIPILGGRVRFAKLILQLTRKGLALLYGTGNDNA